MTVSETIGEYIRLARLHSAVLSGLTALFGALAMNPDSPVLLLIELFILGIFVHIFGFVLNEYFDLEVDRHLAELSTKPLVSGAVKPKNALMFCISAVVVSYLILLQITKDMMFWPLIFLTLTFIIFYAYDKWGKSLAIADALLAGYVGFLCVLGASVVDWPINALAGLIAVLAFSQLFLQNALANLKDVPHDKKAGAKTTAIRLGVMVDKKTNSFIISRAFKGHILAVKLIHVIFIFGYLYLYTSWEAHQVSLIIIAIIVMMGVLMRILNMRFFERENLLRLIGGHELITYAIIPLLFINILGPITIVLLIIFPVIWLATFMMVMYGRLLPNI
jgi:4-hydroxybenzoate polyprenyltransferase